MKLSALTAALLAAGIEEAACEARLLFSAVTGCEVRDLFGIDPEAEDAAILPLLSRRTAREPLSYILGEAPFFRSMLKVSPDCLIPRADTERLCELAIDLLPRGAHFADLCTGSGAIAVTVLSERTDTTALATDISAGALSVAAENATRLGVSDRLTLVRSDLLTEMPEGRFDAILSNPPYIPTADLAGLSPEVGHEPGIALDGGEDGLVFYRRLLSLGDLLADGGFFLFECGYDQKADMERLAAEYGYSFAPFYDYGKNFRGGILRRT